MVSLKPGFTLIELLLGISNAKKMPRVPKENYGQLIKLRREL